MTLSFNEIRIRDLAYALTTVNEKYKREKDSNEKNLLYWQMQGMFAAMSALQIEWRFKQSKHGDFVVIEGKEFPF